MEWIGKQGKLFKQELVNQVEGMARKVAQNATLTVGGFILMSFVCHGVVEILVPSSKIRGLVAPSSVHRWAHGP